MTSQGKDVIIVITLNVQIEPIKSIKPQRRVGNRLSVPFMPSL